MARVLRERWVRFLALIGDQVYSDGVESIQLHHAAQRATWPSDERLLEWYRHVYRGYFNQSGYRALLEEWPAQMIWDDHDILEGWGSLRDPTELECRLYRAAATAYREYQHLRHVGTSVDDEAPYDRQFWLGDVGFFVLDLRGGRDYRVGRVLGERQWQDLDAFLAEAGADAVPTVFIVASVPIIHLPPGGTRLFEWLPNDEGTDVRDRWDAGPLLAGC